MATSPAPPFRRPAIVLAALATLCAPLGAQLGEQKLFTPDAIKRHLPDRPPVVALLVEGDWDLDGDVDLVFGAFLTPLRLFANDGTGRFVDATATSYPFPERDVDARDWAAGDVDGDGDLDVVFAVSGFADVQNRLYLGDGLGGFADATATHLPADVDQTWAVALGDVDGDRDLDLAFGNAREDPFGGAQSRLYLNDGGGRYTDATATHLPARVDFTRALAFLDADADGDSDLLLANGPFSRIAAAQQNRLYRNDGTGRFTDATATHLPAAMDWSASVVVGDVDGDGDGDALFGNDGPNTLYLNDGTGRFVDASAGRLPLDDAQTWAIALVDIDTDGDPDVVAANADSLAGDRSYNRLYRNDGTGVFADDTAALPTDRNPTIALAVADVDGDRAPDLFLGGRIELFLNARGTFVDATASRLPDDAARVHAATFTDLDADPALDLVKANRGRNALYLGDGTGALVDVSETNLPDDDDETFDVAAGDLDGDGDSDLLFANDGQNRLFLNDGVGRFTDATATGLPLAAETTRAVAFGDLDGDGDLDAVLGNDGRDRVYRNDGSGVFVDASAGLPAQADDTTDVALADLDGDLDLDVVMANDGGRNGVFVNEGALGFTRSWIADVSNETRSVVLGDVDGDGDIDIVFANHKTSFRSDEQNRVYLNDGAGGFVDATASSFAAAENTLLSNDVALGDVDEDGDPDLLVANQNRMWGGGAGNNQVFQNDGTGRFADVTASWMVPDARVARVARLADVDEDGDPDMLLDNRMYVNRWRQIDVPWIVHPGGDYVLELATEPGIPGSTFHVAVPLLSPGRTRIPLPPFGTFLVEPTGSVLLPPVFVPQGIGEAALTIRVPDDAALRGATVHAQAAVLAPVPPARLTGVTADTVR